MFRNIPLHIGYVNRLTNNATNIPSLDGSDSDTLPTAMTTNYGLWRSRAMPANKMSREKS